MKDLSTRSLLLESINLTGRTMQRWGGSDQLALKHFFACLGFALACASQEVAHKLKLLSVHEMSVLIITWRHHYGLRNDADVGVLLRVTGQTITAWLARAQHDEAEARSIVYSCIGVTWAFHHLTPKDTDSTHLVEFMSEAIAEKDDAFMHRCMAFMATIEAVGADRTGEKKIATTGQGAP